MLEKQRRYSQLLEDEGSDEIAGCTLTLEGAAAGDHVVVRHDGRRSTRCRAALPQVEARVT